MASQRWRRVSTGLAALVLWALPGLASADVPPPPRNHACEQAACRAGEERATCRFHAGSQPCEALAARGWTVRCSDPPWHVACRPAPAPDCDMARIATLTEARPWDWPCIERDADSADPAVAGPARWTWLVRAPRHEAHVLLLNWGEPWFADRFCARCRAARAVPSPDVDTLEVLLLCARAGEMRAPDCRGREAAP